MVSAHSMKFMPCLVTCFDISGPSVSVVLLIMQLFHATATGGNWFIAGSYGSVKVTVHQTPVYTLYYV